MMRCRVEWCLAAQREHNKARRQYAHTWHDTKPAGVICVANEFFMLPVGVMDGILAHEVGHLIAGPEKGERAADLAVRDALGIRIRYRDYRSYGRRLEWISAADSLRLYADTRFDF